MKKYLSYSVNNFTKEDTARLDEILEEFGFVGTEISMWDEIHPARNLFKNEDEKKAWIERFEGLRVRRLHSSYYSYPTYFLTKTHYGDFVRLYDGLENIKNYYGDLTGEHIFERWCQEYEIAKDMGLDSFVFHLIDYECIDGAAEITLSREEILQAMVCLLQTFIMYLIDRNLLSADSPVIEIENAGFGLEYGVQRADDYVYVLNQLYDPYDKVRIGWELNHLLHAVGKGADEGSARFMLCDFEITEEMRELEEICGHDSSKFCMKWLEMNLLDERLRGKIHALHLSDCVLKDKEYFRNGRLQGEYGEKIDSLKTRAEKEDYGLDILLTHYDSHVPMGTDGVIVRDDMLRIIEKLASENPDLELLWELKNSKPIIPAIKKQAEFLGL